MQNMTFGVIALAIGISAALVIFWALFYKQKYELQNIKLIHSALVGGFVTRLLLQISEKQRSYNTLPIIVKEIKEFFQFKAVELYELQNGELFAIAAERSNNEIRTLLIKHWEGAINSIKHDIYHSITTDSQGSKLYIVPVKAANATLLLCMQEASQYPIFKTDLEVVTKTLKYIVNLSNAMNTFRLQGQAG